MSPKIICGYCGAPIVLTDLCDTSDLDRGWNHVATPSDWNAREAPDTQHHVGTPFSAKSPRKRH